MKKSTPMLLLERLHPGKPIEQIVREAVEKNERPEAAAADLGVSQTTLRKWCERFGIGQKAAA